MEKHPLYFLRLTNVFVVSGVIKSAGKKLKSLILLNVHSNDTFIERASTTRKRGFKDFSRGVVRAFSL